MTLTYPNLCRLNTYYPYEANATAEGRGVRYSERLKRRIQPQRRRRDYGVVTMVCSRVETVVVLPPVPAEVPIWFFATLSACLG